MTFQRKYALSGWFQLCGRLLYIFGRRVALHFNLQEEFDDRKIDGVCGDHEAALPLLISNPANNLAAFFDRSDAPTEPDHCCNSFRRLEYR